MGKYKLAIFEKQDREKLLAACEDETEYMVIWIFLNTGMHPKNLIHLKPKNLDGDWLTYKRAKNQKPRRELLPHDIAVRLEKWLHNRFRPKNRVSYWHICHEVGQRAGLKDVSPMTLRHTYCLILLESPEIANHPDRLRLVSVKMGCSERVVMQNYLDLEQWKRRGKA